MNVIGITGSSGAGKSTVCDILQNMYQVKVINADKIAKELSKRGTSYLDEIAETFGEDILDENGELKRKKLAELIYNDTKKRKQLNMCTFNTYTSQSISQFINKLHPNHHPSNQQPIPQKSSYSNLATFKQNQSI